MNFEPELKPYWMIVQKATRMCSELVYKEYVKKGIPRHKAKIKSIISHDLIDRFIRDRCRALNLPIIAVAIFVNWADWNTLSLAELSKILKMPRSTVHYYLGRVRQIWPHLFTLENVRSLSEQSQNTCQQNFTENR